MISNTNLGALMGAPVLGRDDEKIGTVGQVFVDPTDGHPNWMTVHTGLFGTHESFVPLEQATWDEERVHVDFDKHVVKSAPRVDTGGALSPSDEEELYRYYGLAGADAEGGEHNAASGENVADTDTDANTDAVGTDAVGTDAAGDRPDDRDRSDGDDLHTGTARLRRYIVTEEQDVKVPVRHEEVRLEGEADPGANIDASGEDTVDEDRHDGANEARRKGSPRHSA